MEQSVFLAPIQIGGRRRRKQQGGLAPPCWKSGGKFGLIDDIRRSEDANPPLLGVLLRSSKNRVNKTPGQTTAGLDSPQRQTIGSRSDHRVSSICPNSRANFQQAIPRKAESQRSERSMRTAERGEQRTKKHRKSRRAGKQGITGEGAPGEQEEQESQAAAVLSANEIAAHLNEVLRT